MMDNFNISGLLDLATHRLSLLFTGHVFSGLSNNTEIIGTLLSLTIGATLVWLIAKGVNRKSVPTLILFIVFFLFYLFVPFKVQVRWVPERTTIYLFLVGFLALSMMISRYGIASRRVGPSHLIVLSATLLVCLSTYYHSSNHMAVNEYYAEYLSGLEKVDRNSTILAIRVVSPMPDTIGMSLHHKLLQGGSYYAVLRDSIDSKHFQARSRFVPIIYKESKNPYSHWITDEEIIRPVPRVELSGFSKISDKPLDYILVWGSLNEALKYQQLAPPLKVLLNEINRDFQLVKVSQPYGRMHLFKNRNL